MFLASGKLDFLYVLLSAELIGLDLLIGSFGHPWEKSPEIPLSSSGKHGEEPVADRGTLTGNLYRLLWNPIPWSWWLCGFQRESLGPRLMVENIGKRFIAAFIKFAAVWKVTWFPLPEATQNLEMIDRWIDVNRIDTY